MQILLVLLLIPSYLRRGRIVHMCSEQHDDAF